MGNPRLCLKKSSSHPTVETRVVITVHRNFVSDSDLKLSPTVLCFGDCAAPKVCSCWSVCPFDCHRVGLELPAPQHNFQADSTADKKPVPHAHSYQNADKSASLQLHICRYAQGAHIHTHAHTNTLCMMRCKLHAAHQVVLREQVASCRVGCLL